MDNYNVPGNISEACLDVCLCSSSFWSGADELFQEEEQVLLHVMRSALSRYSFILYSLHGRSPICIQVNNLVVHNSTSIIICMWGIQMQILLTKI